MSCDEAYDPTALISRRKMAQKVQMQIDRFSWSESEGRFICDMRGKVVFLSDVVKIIEGRK